MLPAKEIEKNMALINNIYQSFDALEEALGILKLEEPLFMTYAAKKAFTQCILPPQKKRD
ncbi:MAG: hypothetical protein MJ210_04340 [Alphaproteobacteria bacterium]|nr:hypothetical protein [Alphaproteobacteria bacterium]